RARPQLASRADAGEEMLQVGGCAVRIAASRPLTAVEHEINPRCAAGDADAIDATAERQGIQGIYGQKTRQTDGVRGLPDPNPLQSFPRGHRSVPIQVPVRGGEGILAARSRI